MKTRLVALGAALIVSGSLALAQAPGPGGQPTKQTAGVKRAGGNQKAMGGAMLLRRPDVQKELNLTAEQKANLTEHLQALRGTGKTDPTNRQTKATQLQQAIKEVLTDAQEQRLAELGLQRQGAAAIGRPDIAQKLGLSQAQQSKIREISRTAMQKVRGELKGTGKDNRGAARDELQKTRQEANAQILAVLSPDQRGNWEQMLGKPFRFENRKR